MFRFFGKDRKFPLGPAIWAIRTRAAFVPTFIIPESYKRFRIVFEHPIECGTGNIEKDKVTMTEQFIAISEKYVRKYPQCWHFWDEMSAQVD